MALKDKLKKALLLLPKISVGVNKWLGFPQPAKTPIGRFKQAASMPKHYVNALINVANIPSYFIGGVLKKEPTTKVSMLPPDYFIRKGIKGIEKKTPVFEELPNILKIPEKKKKTRFVVGMGGELLTPGMPVATPAIGALMAAGIKPIAKASRPATKLVSKAIKPLEKYADDIFNFIARRIKKIEPGEITYITGKHADDLLKKIKLPKKVLEEIKSGKPIELEDILVQYQPAKGNRPQRLLVSNISRKLEEAVEKVKPKLKVKVQKAEKIVEEIKPKLKVKQPKLKVPLLPQEKEYIKAVEEIKAGKDIEKLPEVGFEPDRLEAKFQKVFSKLNPEAVERKQRILNKTKAIYDEFEAMVKPSKVAGFKEIPTSKYEKIRERIVNTDNPVVKLVMRYGPADPELRDKFINKLIISGGMKDFTENAMVGIRKGAEKKLKQLGHTLDRDILGDVVWGIRKVDDFKLEKPVAEIYERLADDIHALASFPVYSQLKLEDEWIKAGLMKENQRSFVKPETFAKNIDKYLRTVYDDARKEVEKVWGMKIEPAKSFVKLGLPTSWAKKKIPLEIWGKKAIELDMKAKGKTDETIKKAVKSMSKDELRQVGATLKEKVGWKKDPFDAFHLTVSGLVKRWADALAIDEIVKNPEWVSNVEKEGFTKIKKDVRYGPLAGKFIRDDIAKELKAEISPSGKHPILETLETIRPLYRLWKAGKVLTRPFTYLANLISGFIMNDMAGAPIYRYPKTFVKSVKGFFTKKGERFNEAMANGLFGGTFAGEELSPQLALQAGKLKNIDDAFKFLGQNYSHIDNVNKFYLYNLARKRGLSPIEAVRYAFKWQLDYRRLPNLAKTLRDIPIASPFVSFQYLMIPRIIETMMTKPWKLLKYPALFMLWKYGFAKANNMSVGELNARKPTWADGKLAVIPVGIDDNNNVIWFDLSRVMPFDLLGILPTPSMGFANVSGVAGIWKPVTSGQGAFGQKVIPDYEEENLATRLKYGIPEGIKTAMPSTYRDVIKGMTGVLGLPYGQSQRVLTPAETAGAFFGMPIYASTPNAIKKRISMYKMKMAAAKAKLNKILRSSTSPAVKRKAIKEYYKTNKKWISKISEVYRALQKSPNKTPINAFTIGGQVGGATKLKLKNKSIPKAPKFKVKIKKPMTIKILKPKRVRVKLKKKPKTKNKKRKLKK